MTMNKKATEKQTKNLKLVVIDDKIQLKPAKPLLDKKQKK